MHRSTVLVVTSNPFQLALMADLLEANDIRTVRSDSAQEALAAAKREHPTMVLVDLELDKAEVTKVVDGLKADVAMANVPVMVVAPKGQLEMVNHILRECAAAGGFVEKPIDTSIFPRVVMDEIRRHTTGVSRETEF